MQKISVGHRQKFWAMGWGRKFPQFWSQAAKIFWILRALWDSLSF